MKRVVVTIALLVILPAWMGCQKAQFPPDQKISVLLNQCSKNRNGVYICFDSLITDSRCPEDVVCVWSGDAVVKISFHEGGNTHRFNMSIYGTPAYGFHRDTLVAGYKLTFDDLGPHPRTNVLSPQPEIPIATFVISK